MSILTKSKKSKMHRFQRIYRVFGLGEFLRTIILFVGSIGMALFSFFYFSSLISPGIVIAGLLLGWTLRKQIVQGLDYYSALVPIGLFIYGLVLFVGKRMDLDHELMLNIITVTTVILFNLKFWTLSDPEVLNLKSIDIQ